MTRKEFLKICGIFGIGFPFPGMLSSCNKEADKLPPFSGKVLIIGAGAGGLSAGYFLAQQGTDFEILEASSVYGGRMKIDTSFADFPIPLGAEWLETSRSIFKDIVNDSSVPVNVPTIADGDDYKFVDYSWFDFFADYIIPSVVDKISLNTVVEAVDYQGNEIVVTASSGQLVADKVIVSVPLQVLKHGDVNFSPPLPQVKWTAMNEVDVWEGFKAFFEFSTNFYGNDPYYFPIIPESRGQKIYYNAAFGQNTDKHILGLFTVGSPAQDFITRSGDELKDFILDELDGIYTNQATPSYLNHITQNWNNEPFIKGGYMTDYADWRKVREIGKSVAGKVYFAGGEFTDGEDWVSVHTAAQSAKRVVAQINQ